MSTAVQRIAATLVLACAVSAAAVPANAATTPARRHTVLLSTIHASRLNTVRLSSVHSVNGRTTVTDTTVAVAEVPRALQALDADPTIVDTSLDSRVRADAAGPDPLLGQQWALTTLKSSTALKQHDATGVMVAVVDSGVQASHPDLAGVVVTGTDFVTPGGDGSADGNGHGTHVAGIISAVANNGIGVAGLAQGAHILPVRVLDNNAGGWASDIAKGIIWATDHGAKVISMSLMTAFDDSALRAAVSYASARGVVMVAAAGNSRQFGNPIAYPAAYAGVLGVAATDQANAGATFSTIGSFVGISAPGVNILSTYKNSEWAVMSGTSMATPYVAATAALVRSAQPTLPADQVLTTLTNTATDLGPAGKDPEFGAGLVNPAAALCSVGFCGSTPPPTTPVAPPTNPTGKKTATLSVAVPTSITYGGTLTVTGSLTVDGQPLAATALQVCPAPATLAPCASVTTAKNGTWSASLRPTGKGSVSVTYAGSATISRQVSPDTAFDVLSTLVAAGNKATLVATIKPVLGQKWTIERYVGATWTGVLSGTLSTTGVSASVSATKLVPGQYRLRILPTNVLSETILNVNVT